VTTISNNQWVEATVIDIATESPEIKTFKLKPTTLLPHVAGQHYELRLTGDDGYQAARLYSAAPVSDDPTVLCLSIQLVPTGEVTPYVHGNLAVGDTVEVRGPFGRFFVWQPDNPAPVLLIGGGSGVIPLVAMLRAHEKSKSTAKMHLIYSARTFDDVIYKDMLLDMANTTITLTSKTPKDWMGESGRINAALLAKILADFPTLPTCYICGMSPFVSAMNELLQSLGIPLSSIKTERFG